VLILGTLTGVAVQEQYPAVKGFSFACYSSLNYTASSLA